jgi:serine protease
MRKNSPGLLLGLIICVLATACGGGGGGGGGGGTIVDTPPPPAPVDPAPAPVETFTLSGTITVSSSQAVDSDTNDLTQTAVSNDTPGNPQLIPNPVTVGGYINVPGTGPAGRSRAGGDLNDFFQVDLLAGQRVTMLVADFEQADADLYLMDTQGEILASSIDTGEVETLLIENDGTYLVNAFAYAGATNYIIAIGSPNETAQYHAQDYKIVPWQAVVTYRDDDPKARKADPSVELSRSMGLQERAGGPGRSRLLALRQGLVDAQQKQQRLGRAAEKLQAIRDPAKRARWETLMTIKSLRKDPRVLYAEPNYEVSTRATPDDTAYPLQWHYPLIGLPDAWETTTGDSAVVVAVVDTGILSGHPDLVGQLVNGYDFVSDPANAGDGDGIDPDPAEPAGSSGNAGQSFHGTHVSGTVAARGNNQLGVAGSAYSTRVMPVRALGTGGGGTSYDVVQAVRYAAGLTNDSDTVPQQRADIINLSLGGAPFDPATQNLYNAVRDAGILVVAAAGNQASAAPDYPAAYDGVISVSAVDLQRRLAAYSNTGSAIDVAAPGGDNSVDLNGDGYPDGVLSTSGRVSGNTVNFTYSFLSGTSMASPHVAGVLALMKSVNPNLTPADIDSMLAAGLLSDDVGVPGRDNQFGYGIINAQRSVLAALEATGNSPADNPRLTASVSTLNFGGGSTSLSLILRNGGKGDLALLNLSASEPWLQIAATSVDAAGLGEYAVTVDRSNLPPGIYSAEITAQSSVNNLAVQVLVSAGGVDTGADLGKIYILLYDPLRNETVAERGVRSNGLGYSFEFAGIPAGEYELVAGTDADNDQFICDSGEACGAWLTVDQPIRIALNNNVSGLNFPVDYLVSLPTGTNAVTAADALDKRHNKADQRRRIGETEKQKAP